MKVSNTSTRLKQLMIERNIKQIDIINKCMPLFSKYNTKIGKNDLSQYVNGKVEPGQLKLSILAEALNVSEAWLMGYDVPMNNDSELLVQIYNSLNEDNKKKLLELAQLYANSNNNKD